MIDSQNTITSIFNPDMLRYLYTFSIRALFMAAPVIALTLLRAKFVKHKQSAYPECPIGATQSSNNRHKKITITGLLVFFLMYSYLIFYGEEFVGLDIHQLTLYPLSNIPWPMPIWAYQGRFWPLGMQEYNFIAMLSKEISTFHLFSIAQLALLIILVIKTTPFLNWLQKAGLCVLILSSPGITEPFLALIQPERNLVVLLALFIYLWTKESKPDSSFSYILILLSVQLMLYLKEPAFLMLGSIASAKIGMHIFNQRKEYNTSYLKTTWHKHYTELSIIILSAIYAITYIIITNGKVKNAYNTMLDQDTYFSTLSYYLTNDTYIYLLVIASTALIHRFYKNGFIFDPKWDSLLIGSATYFLIFIKLKLSANYYIAPAIVLTYIYLSSLASDINKDGFTRTTIFIILCFTILAKNASASFSVILNHKTLINIYTEAAMDLENSLKHTGTNKVNIFSPNSGQTIMEFAAFLHYRGLNTLHNESMKNSPMINFLTPVEFQDNLCVPWVKNIRCTAGLQDKAEYLIVLPEVSSETPNPNIDTWAFADSDFSIISRSPPNLIRIESLRTMIKTREIEHTSTRLKYLISKNNKLDSSRQ